MTRLLIVYGSTEGHTRDIALHRAGAAEAAGHKAECRDSTKLDSLQDLYWFDGVIVGVSVHQRRRQSSIRQFVLSHRTSLSRLPSAFFSVSLSAAVQDEVYQRETQAYIADFLAETGWRPQTTASFAGALRQGEYDYFQRMILRVLSRQDSSRPVSSVIKTPSTPTGRR